MIHIAICDDIQQEREQISAMLMALQDIERNWVFEITQYDRGELLLLDLEERRNGFHLIFLDIYMEGINGMETARKIRGLGLKTPLVFLTGSPDFALESYDVNAAGYLLKPVQKEKMAALLERLLGQEDRTRICIQSERRRRYLFLDEIVFVESDNHSILLHLANGETLTSGEKLGTLEGQLDERFLRCHQSFLVNMCFVADVAEDFILKDGRRVPIRIRQRKAIADAYYRFFVKRALGRQGTE